MEFSTEVVSKLLDLCPAQAALIDENGKILAVNRCWLELQRGTPTGHTKGSEGSHYLTEPVFRAIPGDAETVNSGILSVLSGASKHFSWAYESGSPGFCHQFRLAVAPIRPSEDLTWALLLHIDLTDQCMRAGDLVTICGWCKRLPAKENWVPFEEYFSNRDAIRFTHGICPECSAMTLQDLPVRSRARRHV